MFVSCILFLALSLSHFPTFSLVSPIKSFAAFRIFAAVSFPIPLTLVKPSGLLLAMSTTVLKPASSKAWALEGHLSRPDGLFDDDNCHLACLGTRCANSGFTSIDNADYALCHRSWRLDLWYLGAARS